LRLSAPIRWWSTRKRFSPPLEESEFGMSPQALGGVTQRLYVVVEDPDAHCERTKAGGAQIVWGPADTDYGARMYSARDLEGHIWSFGTYWPILAPSPDTE